MKPLRTALFAPGNRPDRAEKALGLGADAVIIDLEDAVPIAEKESTRPVVKDVLEKHVGKRIYVRVNALTTPYAKGDVAGVVSKNLTGIMLPKVESADDIFEIDDLLSKAEANAGLKDGSLEVMPICETAKGLEEAYSIASARPPTSLTSAPSPTRRPPSFATWTCSSSTRCAIGRTPRTSASRRRWRWRSACSRAAPCSRICATTCRTPAPARICPRAWGSPTTAW